MLVSVKIGRAAVSVVAGDDDAMFLQWDERPVTAPFEDEWVSGVYTSDEQAVLAGRVPAGATAVEVVAPDGGHVHGTIGSGAWIAVVKDNHLGIEAYPVLFRDARGAPVKRHIPADWARRPLSREVQCPACGSNEWDLITATWEGEGPRRSTHWGHYGDDPGRAYVCRVCGHAHPFGTRHQY
jgi:hypothetical protein